MRSSPRRRLSLLLSLCLLACFLQPASGGAASHCESGGRQRPDEGGIGGTGAHPSAPDDDDGIGGTGISAGGDVGVIGTITGFASICVGELEIHYGPGTPVLMDGQPATDAELAVGQVVEVVATGTGSEVNARRIAVRHIVVGPVTGIDGEHSRIDVIGQTVQLSPATRDEGNEQESTTAAAFPLHSFVTVSGMRRADGVVMASRIVKTDARHLVQVVGTLTKSDSGMLAIAGTPIRAEGSLSVGDELNVVGVWDGRAIVARTVESIPRVPFDGRVTRVEIEGYARASATGQLQIGPFSVELPSSGAPGALAPPASDARVRIHAVVRDRHVIVERLGILELPSRSMPPPQGGRGWHGPGPGNPVQEAPSIDLPRFKDRVWPSFRDGQRMEKPDPPGERRFNLPQRPDPVDRPSVIELPDRPLRPDRPPRPERGQIPDRPPRPERPHFHGRP